MTQSLPLEGGDLIGKMQNLPRWQQGRSKGSFSYVFYVTMSIILPRSDASKNHSMQELRSGLWLSIVEFYLRFRDNAQLFATKEKHKLLRYSFILAPAAVIK